MTHRWSVPDGCWLADCRWICQRCGADAHYFVDTRHAPPCRGRWWPWAAERIDAFRARVHRPT